MRGEFTILFDKHFWVGLFSVEVQGKIVRVGKYVFGPEPSAAEVYEWLGKGAPGLVMNDVKDLNYEPSDFVKVKNPKRVLREVRRSESRAEESIAQRCMREQVEQFKKEAKKRNSDKDRERKQRLFEMKTMKRKKKHRGH